MLLGVSNISLNEFQIFISTFESFFNVSRRSFGCDSSDNGCFTIVKADAKISFISFRLMLLDYLLHSSCAVKDEMEYRTYAS